MNEAVENAFFCSLYLYILPLDLSNEKLQQTVELLCVICVLLTQPVRACLSSVHDALLLA